MNPPMQSWFDAAVMPTLDPRSIIQSVTFQDSAGALQPGTFTRSANWLQATTWANSPLSVTPRATAVPNVVCPVGADYSANEEATSWNATVAMTCLTNQIPIAAQKTMILKAGPFVNNLYFDWAIGETSQDVQLSFLQNSLTSGDFTNSGTGTVPVFAFPTTATFGSTARVLGVTLRATGRFNVGLRVVDNHGVYSMFEMFWIVS